MQRGIIAMGFCGFPRPCALQQFSNGSSALAGQPFLGPLPCGVGRVAWQTDVAIFLETRKKIVASHLFLLYTCIISSQV